MATKILRGTYSAGYNLTSHFSRLEITQTAEIGGTGVSAGYATIVNAGTVSAAQGTAGGPGYYNGGFGNDGIDLAGGSMVNHGLVHGGQGGTGASKAPMGSGYGGGAGGDGVLLTAWGHLVDSGEIDGGDGGLPGSGKTGQKGSGGQGGDGVLLLAGGSVINTGHIAGGAGGGSPVFSGTGGYGVAIFGDATVSNQGGTIAGGNGGAGGGGQGRNANNGAAAVWITFTGYVFNSGLIVGGDGGSAYSGSGRSGSYGGYGVAFQRSGTVDNRGTIAGGHGGAGGRSKGDGGAGGGGGDALYLGDFNATTVTNFGLIIGGAGGAGGTSSGGGGAGAGGLGGCGIATSYGYGYGDIVNHGVIAGGAGGAGSHGSAGDGGAGVVLSNGATLVNFGTVEGGAAGGSTALQGYGIRLTGASVITNAQGAAIAGQIGIDGHDVFGSSVVTVINRGLIEGARYSVQLNGVTGNTVVARAGAQFIGEVSGGRGNRFGVFLQGGVFDLAGGVGTITGLGKRATVTGAVTADLRGFGTYGVDAGGRWALEGTNALAAGQSLIVDGALTVSGSLGEAREGAITVGGGGVLSFEGGGGRLYGAVVNDGLIKTQDGDVTIDGAITGLGGVAIEAGVLNFKAAFDQAVTFAGKSGALELADSIGFTASISGLAAYGGQQSLGFGDIQFVSADEATFSGTSISGVLTVTDGTHTARINLTGNYLSTTFVASADGHGGTEVVTSAAPPAVQSHALISAMAWLGAQSCGEAHVAQTWFHRESLLAAPHEAIA